MGLSHFLLVHSLFLLSVFTLEQTDSPRYKGTTRLAEGVLYFANFAPFLNHKLNHSEVMHIRTVVDEEGCIIACIENSECRSVNMKTTPDENARHICELLDTDKFTSYQEFDESLHFNHYSFTVGFFQKSYIIIYRVFLLLNDWAKRFFLLFQASLRMGEGEVTGEKKGTALSEGKLFLISQKLLRRRHYFCVPLFNKELWPICYLTVLLKWFICNL